MNIQKLSKSQYPFFLQQISQLPEEMDIIGTMPPETYKFLCVVGSRSYSEYGKEACRKIILGLKGYPIVIVSGLAIGIDSIAHEAALEAGLKTIAFPGSGLDGKVLYPREHYNLARRIVEAGGALLSPFKQDQTGVWWTFPQRNRLMAGISQATLIIEAKEGSGTLLTAGNAGEFNRDILAVPGSIFSQLSWGPHDLIRNGAIAVTSSEEVLEVLGLLEEDQAGTPSLFESTQTQLSLEEKKILEKMSAPIKRDDLIAELKLPTSYINSILVELELKGIIKEINGLLHIK